MSTFDDISQNIEDRQKLTKLTAAEIDSLRDKYPQLPSDYFEFLVQVGYGNLGPMQLYGEPNDISEFLSSPPQHLKGILIFADDLQGYFFGFEPRANYRVVEIGPNGQVATDLEPDFYSLLRNYLRP